MAIDGDGWPHLVWVNEIGGTFRIYHSKWNGANWDTSPQTVFETSIGQTSAPDIAVSVSVGGSIHVVWADYYAGESHIYYAESEDGRTWFEGSWIPGATGSVPALAVDNDGTIHVAWQDAGEPGNTQNDIFYCARPYGGDWPLVSENVSQSPDVDSTRPDLVLDATGQQVHLVWEEGVNGSSHVYYGHGINDRWDILRLSETPSDYPLPCITTDGSNLYAAWNSDAQLLCKQWTVSTGAWSDALVLAENESGVRDIYVSADSSGAMHAVWAERETSGIWDIHYGREINTQPTPTPTVSETPTSEPTLPTPTLTATATLTPSATMTLTPAATIPITPSGTTTTTPSPTIPPTTQPPTLTPTSEPTSSLVPSPSPTTTPASTVLADVWFLPYIVKPSQQESRTVTEPVLPEQEEEPTPEVGGTQPNALDWNWSEPLNISLSGIISRAPAIEIAPDRKVHVAWEEGTHIYHRYWDGLEWSAPNQVATGERPALACAPDGTLHMVFANEFGGKMNIYHVQWTESTSWSLPSNVSGTSGASSNPDIAIASGGIAHIVWTDTTPGHPEIYYGYWNGLTWSTWFIPNATGSQPSIAVNSADVVMVAWQDTYDPGDAYDIYFSQKNASGWSLPVWVDDDSIEADSVSCDLVVGPDDRGHIVWQEEGNGPQQAYYCEQNAAMWWDIPVRLSAEETNAQLPAIGVGLLGDIQVSWDEGVRASYRRLPEGSSEWMPITTISTHSGGISDVAISANGEREAHVVWSQDVGGGDWDIFYSRQTLSLPYQVYLPLGYSSFCYGG